MLRSINDSRFTVDKALRCIRRFCLECQGRHPASVLACMDSECFFFPWRSQKIPVECEAKPLRGIRRYCLSCAGNRQDVRACDAGRHGERPCALWSFRFGVQPGTFKRVLARRRQGRQLLLPGLQRELE